MQTIETRIENEKKEDIDINHIWKSTKDIYLAFTLHWTWKYILYIYVYVFVYRSWNRFKSCGRFSTFLSFTENFFFFFFFQNVYGHVCSLIVRIRSKWYSLFIQLENELNEQNESLHSFENHHHHHHH